MKKILSLVGYFENTQAFAPSEAKLAQLSGFALLSEERNHARYTFEWFSLVLNPTDSCSITFVFITKLEMLPYLTASNYK